MATKIQLIQSGHGATFSAGKNTVKNSDGTFTVNGSYGEISVSNGNSIASYSFHSIDNCDKCAERLKAYGFASLSEGGYVIYLTDYSSECYLELTFKNGSTRKMHLGNSGKTKIDKIIVPFERDVNSIKLFCGYCFQNIIPASGDYSPVPVPGPSPSYRYECLPNGMVRYFIKNMNSIGAPRSFLFYTNGKLQYSIQDIESSILGDEETAWDFGCNWKDIKLVGYYSTLNLTHNCICEKSEGGPITP